MVEKNNKFDEFFEITLKRSRFWTSLYKCKICERNGLTYSGRGQHIRTKHPGIYSKINKGIKVPINFSMDNLTGLTAYTVNFEGKPIEDENGIWYKREEVEELFKNSLEQDPDF